MHACMADAEFATQFGVKNQREENVIVMKKTRNLLYNHAVFTSGLP